MSYTFRYDPDLRVFRIHFEGHVDMDEILRSDREIISTPEWPGSRRILTSLAADADLSALTVEQYLDVALPYMEATQDLRGEGAREAWIIPERWNSPIIRVWEHLPLKDGHHAFGVFEAEPSALAWLLAD